MVSQPVKTTAPVKTEPVATTTSSSGGLGLFDESGEEDDLFTTLSTQKSKQVKLSHCIANICPIN